VSFVAELKRRNVVKVAIAYAAISWLLIQLASLLEESLGLPAWFDAFVIVSLAIGLPVALILAWAFELTPEGIRPTESVAREASITPQTGQRLTRLTIGVLVVAVVLLLADRFFSDDGFDVLPNSIAVLPLNNLSPSAEDAYFAIGLHEEILNQLAKISNMNVIARTTMDRYADTDKSMEEIASELNVATVMEGNVRYANGRVRVTTQLIDGVSGVHLWSETYEAPFEDIFGIESDIAMSVANAMAVKFSLAEQTELEDPPTVSAEAYALYLSSLESLRRATRDGVTRAIEQLDRALELDPDFALAWSRKASTHTYATVFFPESAAQHLDAAQRAIERATALRPGSAPPHIAAAMLATGRGQWQLAATEFAAASVNGPLEPLAAFQFVVGNIEAGYENILGVGRRDPLNSDAAWWVVYALDILGDAEGSMMEYERGLELFEMWPSGQLQAFWTLLGSGQVDRARALAPEALAAVFDRIDEPEAAIAELRALYPDEVSANFAAPVAAFLGDQEFTFEVLRDWMRSAPTRAMYLWRPVLREVRERQDFRDLLRELGLVAYWREHGWPDLCHPIGGDDFRCD